MSDGSDVASVMQTLRVLQQQATRLQPLGTAELGVTERAQETDFAERLKSALETVNDLQKDSAQRADGFVRGEHKDLVGTMVAAQKASVAFQATLQTRNRLVSAYQDIMNMPL